MRTISNLLSAMFVIFFTYYLINNPEVFDVFSKIKLESIFILLFVKFLTLYLNGLFNFDRPLMVYSIIYVHQ